MCCLRVDAHAHADADVRLVRAQLRACANNKYTLAGNANNQRHSENGHIDCSIQTTKCKLQTTKARAESRARWKKSQQENASIFRWLEMVKNEWKIIQPLFTHQNDLTVIDPMHKKRRRRCALMWVCRVDHTIQKKIKTKQKKQQKQTTNKTKKEAIVRARD